MHKLSKREFLAAGIGAGLGLSALRTASAQRGRAGANRIISTRRAKTTKLFRSPEGFPNAIAVTHEGLWIGEQKLSGPGAVQYHLPEPKDLTEHAWLVDWNGKVLKTVSTQSRNTSGMAVGGGYVWMCANAPPQGVFQVDMNSREVSHSSNPTRPAGQRRRLSRRHVARRQTVDRCATPPRYSPRRSHLVAAGILNPFLRVSGSPSISRRRVG